MTQPQEVLKVTSDGEFIWHEDADRMIAGGDFSHAPAMQHMLKALRVNQRPWQGLTDNEIRALASWWPSYDQMPTLMVLAKDIQDNLKERNNGLRKHS